MTKREISDHLPANGGKGKRGAMKKCNLTARERKVFRLLLDKMRIELAALFDSQGVDCCLHLLNILEGVRHVRKN